MVAHESASRWAAPTAEAGHGRTARGDRQSERPAQLAGPLTGRVGGVGTGTSTRTARSGAARQPATRQERERQRPRTNARDLRALRVSAGAVTTGNRGVVRSTASRRARDRSPSSSRRAGDQVVQS